MTTADYKAAAKELRQLNYELAVHRMYCENVKRMIKPEHSHIVRAQLRSLALLQASYQAFADHFFNGLL